MGPLLTVPFYRQVEAIKSGVWGRRPSLVPRLQMRGISPFGSHPARVCPDVGGSPKTGGGHNSGDSHTNFPRTPGLVGTGMALGGVSHRAYRWGVQGSTRLGKRMARSPVAIMRLERTMGSDDFSNMVNRRRSWESQKVALEAKRGSSGKPQQPPPSSGRQAPPWGPPDHAELAQGE